MSHIISTDFLLEVAKGNVTGHASENKFGRAPSGLQTTATDVWDRADAVPTQQIWVAPATGPEIHDIASTSASDDGSPAGVGARTIRVVGLVDWGTAETTEDLTLNGTTPVPTVNAYVIIHRLEVLTKGATNVNVGTITATAQVSGSVTAVIRPSIGQTQMAIYGIPSTQEAFVIDVYAHVLRAAGANASADMSLLYNPEPDVELTNFLTKHTLAAVKDGDSAPTKDYRVPKRFVGPGILKVQGIASAVDLDVSAGFDLVLETT